MLILYTYISIWKFFHRKIVFTTHIFSLISLVYVQTVAFNWQCSLLVLSLKIMLSKFMCSSLQIANLHFLRSLTYDQLSSVAMGKVVLKFIAMASCSVFLSVMDGSASKWRKLVTLCPSSTG